MTYDDILNELESLRNPDALPGMAKFGITPERAYGVRVPELRRIAKVARSKDKAANHLLAARLWANDTRETRILASMIDDPGQVTEAQMEAWVAVFDYWEICDQVIMNLFDKLPNSYAKAIEWSEREAEFEKRAGFVMMARLAVSDKKATDARFLPFLPIILEKADDPRNMVKKGVNWALRQIGKRNVALHAQALTTAVTIQQQHPDNKAAQWVARDALRELQSEAVLKRLK